MCSDLQQECRAVLAARCNTFIVLMQQNKSQSLRICTSGIACMPPLNREQTIDMWQPAQLEEEICRVCR